MAFNDDYIDVATRIAEFREKHPEGCLRPANPDKPFEVIAVGDKTFITVVAAAYRTPDDPMPGIGMAWEPFPGPTNFTKNSELQNAETSAWGRAIVAALAGDTKRGIATSEDVRARADEKPQGPPQRKKGPASLGPDHVPPDVQKARLEAQAALSKLELMPDEIRLGLQAVYGVQDVKGLDVDAALKLAKALASDEKAQAFSARAMAAKAAAESWKEGEK